MPSTRIDPARIRPASTTKGLRVPHALARPHRVRRLTSMLLVTAGMLAVPASAAQAVDNLQPGGVVIPGSALAVSVPGAANTSGAVGVRFAGTTAPLLWGEDMTGLTDSATA